ncbi:DUF732 domain-containing protein [Mycolicibacter virginiensis]|uniref:DUF732 domain-containing protein n=1 Tax=Mycolicibacter virginiensis TaxID=1795032 RepID=UPI00061A8E4C|nr:MULTISPECIES: DUF732 domain-containing protein [Mycobacteriaceae]ULP48926.1 DUF732 domain-containing protein [Mycolicibacter virginiensis]
MKPLLAALALPAAVLLASPASATPADFENAVREQGIDIGMMVFNPGGVAASGMETCNRLRNGQTLPEVLAAYPNGMFGDGARLVPLAQKTICPETIK